MAGRTVYPASGVAMQLKQTAITPLTDNSGGTADDTIAAIGATYNQAEVRNAIADLTAKVNALIAAVKAASITS